MNTCRSCGASILWAETEVGKRIPLDSTPEHRLVISTVSGKARVMPTYISHFATCPNAAAHRKPKGEGVERG
jgi:hypothetical protein